MKKVNALLFFLCLSIGMIASLYFTYQPAIEKAKFAKSEKKAQMEAALNGVDYQAYTPAEKESK